MLIPKVEEHAEENMLCLKYVQCSVLYNFKWRVQGHNLRHIRNQVHGQLFLSNTFSVFVRVFVLDHLPRILKVFHVFFTRFSRQLSNLCFTENIQGLHTYIHHIDEQKSDFRLILQDYSSYIV